MTDAPPVTPPDRPMLSIRCANHVLADAAYRRLLQQARPGAGPAGVIHPPAGAAPFVVSRTAAGELQIQPLR